MTTTTSKTEKAVLSVSIGSKKFIGNTQPLTVKGITGSNRFMTNVLPILGSSLLVPGFSKMVSRIRQANAFGRTVQRLVILDSAFVSLWL